MPQKTDLNVAPYFDDFSENKNFHRVLFRPGFAVQARELTQLQSILQNQIERMGSHIFKEGDEVIPGGLGINTSYYNIQLNTTFSGENIDVSQYLNTTKPVTIRGATTGVKAQVLGVKAATATTSPVLFVQYTDFGTDQETRQFANNESIIADVSITHTTTYGSNVASASTVSSGAARRGCAITAHGGVYYIRGTFVRLAEQTHVISERSRIPSARIGLRVTESIITPEQDGSLDDNSTGSSNFSAKGAHRLQYSLELTSLPIQSKSDNNFIELTQVINGALLRQARGTEYSVLGQTLARRTYDESGDYTVRPFMMDCREQLFNRVGAKDFRGVYTAGQTTDDGNVADEGRFVLAVSPGKAYIRGYEVETPSTIRKDVVKARTTQTVSNGAINCELGNYINVTNVFGQPDVSDLTETTPYGEIELYDTLTSTRGTASGTQIGVCRAKTMQYSSGTVGATSAVHKLFIFDVRMFTVLTLSGTPSPTLTSVHTNGVRLKGASSGATGFVYGTGTSGTTVNLIAVQGTFVTGEKLIASDSAETDRLIENSGNTDLTISSIAVKDISQVKQFVQLNSGGTSTNDFTADSSLDAELTLSGTSRTETTGDDNLISVSGTNFSNEVAVGDVIAIPTGAAGATEDRVVDAVTATALSFTAAPSTDEITTANVVRKRTKLNDPEKNIGVYLLTKKAIKSLLTADNNNSPENDQTIRRQFVVTAASGVISASTASGETFVTGNENSDYTLTCLTAGSGGSAAAGDVIDISSASISAGSFTLNDSAVFGSGSDFVGKLTTTILKNDTASKTKTTRLSKKQKVREFTGNETGAFGTRATDDVISLGRADVFRLQAVYDSEDTSTDAAMPTATISGQTGSFIIGERIVGSTSGVTARIAVSTSPIEYVLLAGVGASNFTSGETITGQSSGATAVVGTLTEGSKIITSSYALDTGQRDNYYDISRLIRKPGRPAPTGRLLCVYDFLEHGSGTFFSVDSYVDTGANQMDYDDIPVYTATKIDPDDPEPSGVYPLADAIDFRPTVASSSDASSSVLATDTITTNDLDFSNRSFTGTGSSSVDTPKPNVVATFDYDFYLSYIAHVFMDVIGEVHIVSGVPAERPRPPKPLDEAIKLAELFVPAYTFTVDDIQITRMNHQRYTMKDIGKLEKRIENLEFYTNLSLLERDTASLELTDSIGVNRFKSGFVVDNFTGHRVGDHLNKDYKAAIDPKTRELRPQCITKQISLIEENTTDTARENSSYRKTGNLLTLPYISTILTQNDYASDTESVQPHYAPKWVGKVELTPNSDSWKETERAPDVLREFDGNFDAIRRISEEGTNNFFGTVWGEWDTFWTGELQNTGIFDQSSAASNVRTFEQRELLSADTKQVRTGITTELVSRTETIRLGDKVSNIAFVPFIRSQQISFKGYAFPPNAKVYIFFDGENVSNLCTPAAEEFTSGSWTEPTSENTLPNNALNRGLQLVTNSIGDVEGTFFIPPTVGPGTENNPSFKTGERTFRITTSATNQRAPAPLASANAKFFAQGLRETVQDTVISTQVAEVVQTTTRDERDVTGGVTRWGNPRNVPNPAFVLPPEPPAVPQSARDSDDDVFVIETDTATETTTTATDNNITTVITNQDEQDTFDNIVVVQEDENVRPTNPAIGTFWTDDRGERFIFRSDRNLGGGFWCEAPSGAARDPIAQTFLVSEAGGCFVTNLDLYFSQKDDDHIVWVEIRDVVNGYPGPKIIPYGVKKLNPEDVNVSDDASVATRFVFDSPVYLREGQEYAIVVRSHVTTYRVWISRMGEVDIGGSRSISKQPHLGVLFKSQNNTAWTSSPSEDLKFTLRKAVFSTNRRSRITFNNGIIGEEYLDEFNTTRYGKKLTRPNPLLFSDASGNTTKVRVKHFDHGMYSTANNVRLSGVSSGATTTLVSGITASATSLTLTNGLKFAASNHSSGDVFLKIGTEVMQGTIASDNFNGNVAVTGLTRATEGTVAVHAAGDTVELYQILGVPLTEINKVHTSISNIQMDSYVISTTTSAVVPGDSEYQEVGGTNVFASENYRYESIKTLVNNMEFPNTIIQCAIQPTSGTSPTGSETSFTATSQANETEIPLGETFEFSSSKLIASDVNESNEMAGNKSLKVTCTLETINPNISPVIDIQDISVLAIGNRMNVVDSATFTAGTNTGVYPSDDFRGSDLPDGDLNSFVYVTKAIPLQNAASSLKVFFIAHRHSTSTIKVLYKILRSDDASEFDELGYEYFNTTGTSDNTVNPSADQNDFQEYEFTAGVKGDGTGTPLPSFVKFAIKIVGQGTNAAEPIRIKDLRAIALAT